MTERELYNHKMTPEERAVWADFCRIIRDKSTLMDIPPMDKVLLEKHLLIEEPYHFARGYSKEEGYYDILENFGLTICRSSSLQWWTKCKIKSLLDFVSQRRFNRVVIVKKLS